MCGSVSPALIRLEIGCTWRRSPRPGEDLTNTETPSQRKGSFEVPSIDFCGAARTGHGDLKWMSVQCRTFFRFVIM